MLKHNQIYALEAREGMRQLPSGSVDCVLTSPPYWGMRDYGLRPTVWRDGSKSVLGLETNLDDYVHHLCEIFDEVRRVLKPTGTVWVNLADTYAGSWGNYVASDGQVSRRSQLPRQTSLPRRGYVKATFRPPSSHGQVVKAKSLCLIPARFAIEMTRRGWILRNIIVWHKPNHMPSSVKDRFPCAWEYLFLFVHAPRYYFDLDAVRVPHTCLENLKRKRPAAARTPRHLAGSRMPPNPGEPGSHHPQGKNPGDYWVIPAETRSLQALIGAAGAVKVPGGAGWTGHPPGGQARILREQDPRWLSPGGKNPGDCWKVPTRPFPGAHFAVYPEALCERPIRAGCPAKVCKKCGMPQLARNVGGNSHAFNIRVRDVKKGRLKHTDRRALQSETEAYKEGKYVSKRRMEKVLGCECCVRCVPGLVLDPFVGSGTTAVVARQLGRHFIGFDANPDYVQLARQRLAKPPSTKQEKGGVRVA